MANFVFKRPRYAGGPIDLVFGATDEVGSGGSSAISGTVVFGGINASGLALYDNKLPNRLSASAVLRFQQAARALPDRDLTWGQAGKLIVAPATHWQHAARILSSADLTWAQATKLLLDRTAVWQQAAPKATQSTFVWQQAAKLRAQASVAWGQAAQRQAFALVQWMQGARRSAEMQAPYQQAAPRQALATAPFGQGRRAAFTLVAPWQHARRVPPGLSVLPDETGSTFTPHVPSLDLVFCQDRYTGGLVNLVFGRSCPVLVPGQVVVPIRSIYMTINSFSLTRLDTGAPIPATAMSLSLDADSWTWSFSFSVNGNLLPFVEPNTNGDPVAVQATINGVPLRLLVEKIGRERSFGSSQLRCSGRGVSAALDAPYAPVLNFNNTSARTVRQLLDDILTINNVSIGWSIDVFEPTDWLVPAGVFSHAGSYISALNAVVGAAGAYIQPHDTTNEMDVLLRYPMPSWEWALATPDLILPSAVVSREGIEWVDKAPYNRVFVSGQQGGVAGRYTRSGTAGDILAPPLVDPLITHVDAVRQRGRAVLSDTGRIANVALRLPVLAETGIVRPGTFVQYDDGLVTRIGLARSVSVEVGMPTVYQNIEVETHVE